MALIPLDSSVLIDHFRVKNKAETYYQKLRDKRNDFAISPIAEYETLVGAKEEHVVYWLNEFREMIFLQVTEKAVIVAREINLQLKRDCN